MGYGIPNSGTDKSGQKYSMDEKTPLPEWAENAVFGPGIEQVRVFRQMHKSQLKM